MIWNGDSNWTDISPLSHTHTTHMMLDEWMKNTTQYYCCLTHCGGSRYVLNTILCPFYHLAPPFHPQFFVIHVLAVPSCLPWLFTKKYLPRLLPSHLPFLSAYIPLVASHKSIGSSQLKFNDAFAIFFDIIFKVLSFNFFTCLYLFILELELELEKIQYEKQ